MGDLGGSAAYSIRIVTLMLLSSVGRVLPRSAKQFLRDRLRAYQFDRSMRQFAAVSPTEKTPKDLIDRLVRGWGNDWSARTEYLSAILDHLNETAGPVLECGSGLSTLLIGQRCQQLGRQLWVFEHHSGWADRVESALRKHKIASTHICRTTIVPYSDFDWYDPKSLPAGLCFDVVVCDGPPADTRGGRYGLLPVVGERLHSRSRIYLDDAARPDEQAILSRWQSEFGGSCQIEGQTHPYAVVRVSVDASPKTES